MIVVFSVETGQVMRPLEGREEAAECTLLCCFEGIYLAADCTREIAA